MTELETVLLERLAAAERRIGALEAELESTERRRKRDRERKAAERIGLPLQSSDNEGIARTSEDVHGNPRTPPMVSLDGSTPPINSSFPPASSPSSARTREEPDPETAPNPTAEPPPRTTAPGEPELLEQLPPAYRRPLADFLGRLSETRQRAWVAALAMLLDGNVPRLRPTGEQLGRAVLEISQAGGDNPQLFRRYVRRVIETDQLDEARDAERAQAPAGQSRMDEAERLAFDETRAAQTRSAPQSFRAQRGRALIEAAELLAYLGKHQHPEFFNSLEPGAWDELGARQRTAVNAMGGLTAVMAKRTEPKIRDDLADALMALPVDSPLAVHTGTPALSLTSGPT